MTQKEKFDAIIQRLKLEKIEFKPEHITAMVIVGYLHDLSNKGLMESEYVITDSGKIVYAVCEEFDWKPSDEEIKEFVVGMVDKSEWAAVAYMITRYRDDKENLLKEIEEFKKNNKEESKE